MVVTVPTDSGGGLRMVGNPIKVDGVTTSYRRAPGLGEHSDVVLRWAPPAAGGWSSIGAMSVATADRCGGRVAVVDGDIQLTYTELVDGARTFGAALVASGVEPGDRVAIWAFNSVEWVIAVLGVFQAGAVLVPVNSRFKGAEAADICRAARAVLVTVTDFLGTDYIAMLDGAGVALPNLETVVVTHGPAPRAASRGHRSSRPPRMRRGARSIAGATPSVPTIPRTSCSRPARRGSRRAS